MAASSSGGGWIIALIVGILIGLYLPDMLKDVGSSNVKLQSPFVFPDGQQ